MSRRHDIRVDVTDAVGTGERLAVAATVAVPEDVDIDDRGPAGVAGPDVARIVLFGFPGGGYNRRYYDLQLDGHEGYSQVEHHVGRGRVFVACDHLAVGDSDVPAVPLDFAAVARANASAARQIVAGLSAGTLIDGTGPIDVAATVAMGQSYGGFLLVIGQGNEPTFDGVAILGYSGLHTSTPWPDGLDLAAMLALEAGNGLDHPMRPAFHLPSVPDAIVAADMTKIRGTFGSDAPWSTAQPPGGAAVVMDRNPRDLGAVAAEAARITVPVFVGNGIVDVVGDPWAEPTAYRGSRDVTVAVFDDMAHMHNFAVTRRALWERLDAWAATVARCAVGAPERSDSQA